MSVWVGRASQDLSEAMIPMIPMIDTSAKGFP